MSRPQMTMMEEINLEELDKNLHQQDFESMNTYYGKIAGRPKIN